MSDVKTLKFKNIFRGLERAYGQMLPSLERNNKGKVKVKRIWTETPNNPKKNFVPFTDEVWTSHLKGEIGLGVVPVTDEGKCKWGCIDIDPEHYIEQKIDHVRLVKEFYKMKLPFIVCSSKSEGAHLLIFTKELVPAATMILKLQGIKAALGLPKKTEVFPKQDKLFSLKDDGSWLNLPYFKGSERKAFKLDGSRATLDEFFDLYDARALSKEDFNLLSPDQVSTFSPKKLNKLKNQDFLESSKCLELITMKGKVKENRNLFCKALTTYLKLRYPEEKVWQQKLTEYVDKYVDTSKDKVEFNEEIANMMESYSKKDYDYQCDDPPICDHCEPVVCAARKYGKKLLTDLESIIVSCRILQGDDPSFFITLNLPIGMRCVEFKSEDLETQTAFSNRVLKMCFYKLAPFDKSVYTIVLNNRLERARKEKIAPELTQVGRFKELMGIFFARSASSEITRLRSNQIYKPEDNLNLRIFKIETVKHWLQAKAFKYTETELNELLDSYGIKKYGTDGRIRVGGHQERVWYYEIPKEKIENVKQIENKPKKITDLNLDGEI